MGTVTVFFFRNLGDTICTIELDTPQVTAEEVLAIENTVNEKIREQVPMYPTLYEGKEDPSLQQVLPS